jgi:hypothetical protein
MSTSPCVLLIAALSACSGPEVAGRACVVVDIRNPDQCGSGANVEGLTVVELTSGARTTTDAAGEFAIPYDESTAILRVAEGRTDRRTSLIKVDDASTDVVAPVITELLWNTYMTALGVIEDPTRATIHLAFPPPAAVIASAGVPGAQILFNQGEAFTWGSQPPADQTFALMALGVPVDAGTATITVYSLADQVIFSAEVPVEAGAITWVNFERDRD